MLEKNISSRKKIVLRTTSFMFCISRQVLVYFRDYSRILKTSRARLVLGPIRLNEEKCSGMLLKNVKGSLLRLKTFIVELAKLFLMLTYVEPMFSSRQAHRSLKQSFANFKISNVYLCPMLLNIESVLICNFRCMRYETSIIDFTKIVKCCGI